MASLKAIVIALSIIFTNAAFITFEGKTLNSDHIGAALVYVISVALFISHLSILSKAFCRRHSAISLIAETCVALVLLVLSIRYLWRYIQEFSSEHSDGVIQNLSEYKVIDNFICYMCCGRSNCGKFFTDILLKMFSFSLLTIAIILS